MARAQKKTAFPRNTILLSANSYLRVHRSNSIMRRGNFHTFARIPREIDLNRIRRKVSWLRRLYHSFIF